jgi:serine O-acetyltransferase
VANNIWRQGREPLALLLQSRISEIFHVDIHPGATLGEGVMFDHATGVVIGKASSPLDHLVTPSLPP